MVAKRQDFYDVSVALSRVFIQFHFVMLATSHLVLSVCNKLSPKNPRWGNLREGSPRYICWPTFKCKPQTQIIILQKSGCEMAKNILEAARVKSAQLQTGMEILL